ncbi:MAG: hypothetical protein HY245_01960 [Rhizobiales bacterium]|nr:hypothetical protein [Hyphomicrobiales bacterium]MBI3672193.1 hypothetical protein [Hyphomicrobiales bacterium]
MLKSAIVIAAMSIFLIPQLVDAQSFQPWNRECGKLAKDWQKKPQHKAVAVSNSTSSEACGLSWAAPSQAAAERSALQACRKYAEGAPCHVVTSE